MNVTAVEIDPVVHRFAEEYFGLPSLRVFHQDGRRFIERADENWDIIVHDVFTGGSVPQSLFTREMWNLVRQVLSDDGVLAVVRSVSLTKLIQNFVGSLGDPSVEAIMSTLLASFNYCRAFRDPFASDEGPSNTVLKTVITATDCR
jgi:spermidine synthase